MFHKERKRTHKFDLSKVRSWSVKRVGPLCLLAVEFLVIFVAKISPFILFFCSSLNVL